jgi:hypothetical protein
MLAGGGRAMSAGAIAALVTALDSLADLDACSRDEKIAAARKILERAPASLPSDIAGWIRESGKKLKAKLQTDTLGPQRRLAYVSTIACNGPPDVAHNGSYSHAGKPAPAVQTENDFIKQTLREIAEADAEIARMPQTRHDQVAAIAKWERDRVDPRYHGQVVPTPYWALYQYDSPEAYEQSKRERRGNLRTPAFAEPPRTAPKVTHELPMLGDALDTSRELQRNHEANETYAEDVDG